MGLFVSSIMYFITKESVDFCIVSSQETKDKNVNVSEFSVCMYT